MKRIQHLAVVAVFLLPACVSAPAASSRPASSRPASSTVDAKQSPSQAARVVGFGYTVRDLDASTRFFVEAVGAVERGRRSTTGVELDALTGLEGTSARAAMLQIGEERVTLIAFAAPGRRGPDDAVSNDLDFQHLALVTSDIDAAYKRVDAAGGRAVSQGGPQRIPDSNAAAAGIRAFYFRDRGAHPLELIWFPADKGPDRWHRDGPLVLGIDHSAIAVSSTEASLGFYRDLLGLKIAGESFNEGIEQERLSGVAGARVRITGLRGPSGPGVEFLEYVSPGPGRRRPDESTPRDDIHWETHILVADLESVLRRLTAAGVWMISDRIADCELCVVGSRAVLVRDPDGHAVRLEQR